MISRYARMGATTAIAVLALSNSPLLAQDTGTATPAPVATEPAPAPATAAPEPTPEIAPASTDSAATSTSAETMATAATPVHKKTVVKTAKTATATTSARPVVRQSSAAAPVAAALPATASVAPAAAKPGPVVDMNAAPAGAAQQPTTEAKSASKPDTAMMVGGGALALLALGGGAFALVRRKDEDDEFADETIVHDEPVRSEAVLPRHDPVQESVVAPPASAFAWGNEAVAQERRSDESWYDRAMRGPTPDNPSQSLRKRLKRAAFFDKREREVDAGAAAPVAADAGLPDNMAAHGSERELELA